MKDSSIYDTSLLNHATFTTIVQKSTLWRGPLCFDEIFNSLKLFHTYTLLSNASTSLSQQVMQVHFKSTYSCEENFWGILETYKRLLGVITFVQCRLSDDLQSAVEEHINVLSSFSSTLGSGLLVVIIHNDSNQCLRFDESTPMIAEKAKLLEQSTLNLPTYAEIAVCPGNGFMDEHTCLQECGRDTHTCYQFSRTLEKILSNALLREIQSLRVSVSQLLDGHFNELKETPDPGSRRVHQGKHFCFPGKLSAPVLCVSIGVEAILCNSALDMPSQIKKDLDWGHQSTTPLNRRACLCRRSKLLGDVFLQLGDFEAGHWHYRNAIRYSHPSDPALWQSAILTGLAASMYLKRQHILQKRSAVDLCHPNQWFSHRRFVERVSPMLDITGLASVLDLASPRKNESKVPQTVTYAMHRAIQWMHSWRKAPSIPRWVNETLYKRADYLVAVGDKAKATQILGSLQMDLVPQGNTYLFERCHVLSRFYTRLGWRRKAGFFAFLMENNLCRVIRIPGSRPFPMSIQPSPGFLELIQQTHSQCLSSPILLESYRLRTSASGFRRRSDTRTRGIFACPMVFPVNTKGWESDGGPQGGWPMLQQEIIIASIKTIQKEIKRSCDTTAEAGWDSCMMLLGLLFSVINSCQSSLSPAYLADCIETLKVLAQSKPMDQPVLPVDCALESPLPASPPKIVRSSFGSPVSGTLYPLSTLVEVHVDKIPILRAITLHKLPQYALPSCMTTEAIGGIVPIDEAILDRQPVTSKHQTLIRQPTFINNPFQSAPTDLIEWVCNDLSYVDLCFDNPFSIPLVLDDMTFEFCALDDDVTENSTVFESSSSPTCTMKAVQVIPVMEDAKEEVIFKPFSGCLFEQVSLHLTHGVPVTTTNGYINEIELPPKSTGNHFTVGLVPHFASEIHSNWRLCGLSYRLITFGGFCVYSRLFGGGKLDGSSNTLGCNQTPSPNSSSLAEANSNDSRRGVAGLVTNQLPAIRLISPLPRLCVLVGPCTHERVDDVERNQGAILKNLAGCLPSFSPCVHLSQMSHNQETKRNLCNVIIDLHAFETRWLPIKLFAVENADFTEESDSKLPGQRSKDSYESFLNLLHISLQTTLTTNKFLQEHNLLMGQFLQILGVHKIKQKLPIKMSCQRASEHHSLEASSGNGYCGTLWLKADSRAFWEAWLNGPTAAQCPSLPTLFSQINIEFASNVSATMEGNEGNPYRGVIGRCVKIGIEIRFLPPSLVPLRVINPTLTFTAENPGVNVGQALPKDSCFFQFQLESVFSSKVKNLLQPSPHCRFYRVEVEVELLWLNRSLLERQNGKPLTIATPWEPFVVDDSSESCEPLTNVEKVVMGLTASSSPETLPGQTGIAIVLRRLTEVLYRASLPPLAVAMRPTDELMLPLPLPHSFGRLLERSIEIRWTARLVLSLTMSTGSAGDDSDDAALASPPRVVHYVLPNLRSGRIVPLSDSSALSTTTPWYFPLLKSPPFVAKLVWGEHIWLQLVHRSRVGLPSYLAHECPVCRELAAASGVNSSPAGQRNHPPVDSTATHIKLRPLTCLPLEIVGGINDDSLLLNSLHHNLTKQFSSCVDSSRRVCVDLTESQADFASESAVLANLQDGLVLHRLWMGLAVYGLDERGQHQTSTVSLSEGTTYLFNGFHKGQTGLFLGGPTVAEGLDNSESKDASPFSEAAQESLLGSLVFLKTGNFFVRGFVGLLPLPRGTEESPLDAVLPPASIKFIPIKQTSQSLVFHVRN